MTHAENHAPAAKAVKWLWIAFAVALNLSLQGYQFGRSNHTVYLLDALRHVEPELLRNDWFTTQTFQYHALFGLLTRGLMKLGIVKPAFLLGYLALLLLLHTAWWRLVRVLGGGAKQFLLSEVLFHLLAAGAGLGMYMFLQDSAFLPSNISAVAMLWGIVLWLERRPIASGVAMGLAGAFHLNYAPVVIVLWILFHARSLWKVRLATALAVVPAAVNVLLALKITARRSGAMPLADFVDIYVRLRHPHHYDPSSWPGWLWLSVLLPVPLAIAWWWRRRNDVVVQQAAGAFVLFIMLIIVALIGAGAIYVSESLVQASLYRFSIFPKLIACVGTASLIAAWLPAKAQTTAALGSCAVGVLMMTIALWRGPYFGLYAIERDSAAYTSACAWISKNTPVDAVFLVPPNDERFRLLAQRAIVVNFKAVPQLSGELIEWRRRMETVLDLSDLRMLPRPFPKTQAIMRDRYNALAPSRLAAIARQCGARYILAEWRFDQTWDPLRIDLNGNAEWFLYDLEHGSEGD